MGNDMYKPGSQKHVGMAISHDTWRVCHQVSLFQPPSQAYSGIGSHYGSPIFSTVNRVVLADTMDHQWAFHQKKNYSVGSICLPRIQSSHIPLHMLCQTVKRMSAVNNKRKEIATNENHKYTNEKNKKKKQEFIIDHSLD